MLYPVINEIRNLIKLDGVWKVALEKGSRTINPHERLTDYFLISVPGSVNDQVVEEQIRDHVGNFWFETEFIVPRIAWGQRNVLRFSSVTHHATVYLNGNKLGYHKGGFTPFEFEINEFLNEGENQLKVCVSNILDDSTLPGGKFEVIDGKPHVVPQFDFYNYCGINRSVNLYSTGSSYIEDIVVKYSCEGDVTSVNPEVSIKGSYKKIELKIIDEEGRVITTSDTLDHDMKILHTQRWEPLNAYLYKLKVNIYDDEGLIDTYTEEFGIRTLKITGNQFLINDKPFYFKGFGRHEDFPVLGRSYNGAVSNLDRNLMKWLGANSFRTAHYPYSEEEMRLADREGFVVIDEVPGVGLYKNFHVDLNLNQNEFESTWDIVKTHEHHQDVIKELIKRDKNHACVVAWAIANEPAGHHQGAAEYFAPMVELTKALDHEKRAVVIPNIKFASVELDELTEMCDIICLNRYFGWYDDHGNLEVSLKNLKVELDKWHKKFPDKPIMLSEFGADTISGLHSLYNAPYSEEFQIAFYKAHFEVLDSLEYVIGEHLWNFADFETAPNIRRIDGNKKGIFTRDRRPKSIAFEIKKRWENLN